MRRKIRNTAIILFPFLLLIMINEIHRPAIEGNAFSIYGATAMNSDERDPDRCTWICYSNTRYCKENHVKYLDSHFENTDPLYFGIINMLRATGSYTLANIIVLAVLAPLLIWFFISRSLNIRDEIRKIKRRQ